MAVLLVLQPEDLTPVCTGPDILSQKQGVDLSVEVLHYSLAVSLSSLQVRTEARAHTQTFTYIYTYVYIHTYICAYIHTYMHTYVRTYVHTHTSMLSSSYCTGGFLRDSSLWRLVDFPVFFFSPNGVSG